MESWKGVNPENDLILLDFKRMRITQSKDFKSQGIIQRHVFNLFTFVIILGLSNVMNCVVFLRC